MKEGKYLQKSNKYIDNDENQSVYLIWIKFEKRKKKLHLILGFLAILIGFRFPKVLALTLDPRVEERNT